MGFDNAQFESAVKTTINTLSMLKTKLSDMSSTGLQTLSDAASKVDLSPLSNGLDSVTSRFSALDSIGFSVINNLTNRVVDAGLTMAKNLTIKPISEGFTEYETKMGAITTIMTNTAHAGTTLDEVKYALADLNKYADQTIYNFADMTKNVGTFTAAGIDLERATKAIKGISNLSAGSGASSADNSRAMYQLSQALAAGVVKAQDWNSVINANIGGKPFQNALIRNAESLGVMVENADNFKATLESGWLTSEILMNTLEEFSENELFMKAAMEVKTWTQLQSVMAESVQSGWADTWELIIGDKDEATELFTAMSEGFNALMNPLTDARNAAFEFWKENGGRTLIIEGLGTALTGLGRILGAIYQGFLNAFPKEAGVRLMEFSTNFNKFMKALSPGPTLISAITNIFEVFFNLLHPFIILFKLVASVVGAAFLVLTRMISPIIKIVGVFARLINMVFYIFQLIGKASAQVPKFDLFYKLLGVLDWINGVLDKLLFRLNDVKFTFLNKMLEKPLNWFFKMYAGLLNSIAKAFNWLGELIVKTATWLKSITWDPMVKFFGVVGEKASAMTQTIQGKTTAALDKFKSKFSSMKDKVKELWDAIDWLPLISKYEWIHLTINDYLNTIVDKSREFFDKCTENMKKLFGKLGEWFNMINWAPLYDIYRHIVDSIKSVFDYIDWGFSLQDSIKLAFNDMFDGLKWLVSNNMAPLKQSLRDVASVAAEAAETYLLIDFEPLKEWYRKTKEFVVDNWGKIDFSAMAAFLAEWYKHTKPIEKGLGVIKTVMDFIKKVFLGTWNAIVSIVVKIGEIFRAVSDFMTDLFKNLKFQDILNGATLASLLMGLKLFKDAFEKTFGKKNTFKSSIIETLESVKETLEGYQKQIKAAIIKKIATALIILAAALFIISIIDPTRLKATLLTSLALFGELIGSMILLGKVLDDKETDNLKKLSNLIIGIGVAILLLSISMYLLAELNWNQIAKGTTALGSFMIMLILLSKGLSDESIDPEQIKQMSKALIVFSIALFILSLSLKMLSKLSWEGLAKGIIGLGAMMGMLVLFLKYTKTTLKDFSPTNALAILVLAHTMTVLAAAVALFGVMPWQMLLRGITGLALSLAAMVGAINLIPDGAMVKAGGLAIIAHSLMILAASIVAFSLIPIKTFVDGLLKVSSALIALALIMKLFSGMNALIGAGAIMTIALALGSLARGLKALGSLEWGTLFKAMLVLGAIVATLVIAANSLGPTAVVAMTALSKSISAVGLGILLIGVGVHILATGLMLIGASASVISVGIMALFTAIGSGLVLLAGSAAAAIVAFVTGLALAVPPLIQIIVVAFHALIGGLMGLVPPFVRLCELLIIEIIEALRRILPHLENLASDILVSLVQILMVTLQAIIIGMTTLVPPFIQFLKTVVLEVIKFLGEVLPPLLHMLGTVLVELIRVIAEKTPIITKYIFVMLVELLTQLRDNLSLIIPIVFEIFRQLLIALQRILPEVVMVVGNFMLQLLAYLEHITPLLVDKGWGIIEGLMYGILTGIERNIPNLVNAVTRIIITFAASVQENLNRIVDAAFKLVIAFINGLAEAIRSNKGDFTDAVANLISAIVDGVKTFMGRIVSIGKDIIGGIVQGITGNVAKVWTAMKDGLSNTTSKVKDFLGINSPSTVFADMAKWCMVGMAEGTANNADLVVGETVNVAENALTAMQDTMSALGDGIDGNMSLNPVITPVLDLSQVQNGGRTIDGMFANSISINGNTTAAQRLMAMMEGRSDMLAESGAKIENTFNINGTNAREIAEEVSMIIQRQMERRDAVWG